jgi:methylenetetrahydrofolate dehydrogenase (NADP+)/methenyltetrahydrofolate cyclohydrolase/formyltetrahydrofolate synthetase
MSEHAITSTVADEKDVDGFGAINIGELAKRGGRPVFEWQTVTVASAFLSK